MAEKRPRLDVAEARRSLQARGIETESRNPAYLGRLLRGAERQAARGLPVSRQAARGHIITPEHPTSRRPIMTVPAAAYTDPARSRYRPLTQPFQRNPTLRTPLNIKRPAVHDYRQAPGAGVIWDTDRRKIIITRSMRTAMKWVKILAAENRQLGVEKWRIGFDIFNCDTGRMSSVFRSPRGHRGQSSEGITADYLLEDMADMTLEEYLIQAELDYYAPHTVFSHVCSYTLYAHRPGGVI